MGVDARPQGVERGRLAPSPPPWARLKQGEATASSLFQILRSCGEGWAHRGAAEGCREGEGAGAAPPSLAPAPPGRCVRCGALGLRGCYSGGRPPPQEGQVPELPPPPSSPRLLLTLTSDEGAGGTLRPRPGGSWGPGLRGTCPLGPGRGSAGRAAGCSGRRPAAGAVGGARLGLPIPRAAGGRRVASSWH